MGFWQSLILIMWIKHWNNNLPDYNHLLLRSFLGYSQFGNDESLSFLFIEWNNLLDILQTLWSSWFCFYLTPKEENILILSLHFFFFFFFSPVGSTAYVRYIQVKADYPHMSTKMRGCNVASLVLGMLSALGLSMVANFQVSLYSMQMWHYPI